MSLFPNVLCILKYHYFVKNNAWHKCIPFVSMFGNINILGQIIIIIPDDAYWQLCKSKNNM
jgi:hypothetical protein